MKKLRESMFAKFAAWVICIIAAMGCTVMGICILVGFMDSSMINSTRSEMLKDAYESVKVDKQIREYIRERWMFYGENGYFAEFLGEIV